MLLFEIGFAEAEGIATVILFGLVFYLMVELRLLRREIKTPQPASPGNTMLPLQAYERLTLFAERMSLKNLVSRMHSNSLTAAELQAGMLETIRTEYEHNITQQNYVNPQVWRAVTQLKEQNIFIINKLAAALPPFAQSLDLANVLLEYSTHENAELSPLVLDAIQFEVKKLL